MAIKRVQLPAIPELATEAETDAHGAECDRLIREALADTDRVIVVYPDGSDDLAYLEGGELVVEGYEAGEDA